MIVYIAHAVNGNIEENLAATRRAIRWVNLTFPVDVVPLCPWYADVVSMDDSDPEQRARGISNDKTTLLLADEVWVFGSWEGSKGVRAEVALATLHNKRVIFFADIPC